MNSNAVRFTAPSLKHYLLLCAATALWLTFSHVYPALTSDTLIFSIASHDAWTPFFWEQDRIGMFVPLLTSWCSSLFATLLMQTAITAFMGLALSLLLVEIVHPRPAGRVAAVLVNALMLAFAPDRIRVNLLFECCYPQAMFLGCAGLLLLGSADRPRWWRYPVSFACFVVAHWIYLGISVWLMPLACWTAFIRPGVKVETLREFVFRLVRFFPGWSSMILIGGSLGMGLWFMAMANEASGGKFVRTAVDSLPPRDWTEAWKEFAERFDEWPEMPCWRWSILGAASAGFLLMLVPRFRPGWDMPAACFVLLATGATEYLFIGTRGWPAVNDYHFRYVLGSIVCLQVILGLIATAPIDRLCEGRWKWFVFGVAALLMLAAAASQYGFPHPHTPRADLDRLYGARANAMVATGADAIGGGYKTVWPLHLYLGIANGDREPPYPLAYRASVFRPKWEATHPAGLKVAVVAGSETETVEFFRAAKDQGFLEPVRTGTQDGLDIYLIRPASTTSVPSK